MQSSRIKIQSLLRPFAKTSVLCFNIIAGGAETIILQRPQL